MIPTILNTVAILLNSAAIALLGRRIGLSGQRSAADASELPALHRLTAASLDYLSDLHELPAGYAWTPDMLRAEADRLEANP